MLDYIFKEYIKFKLKKKNNPHLYTTYKRHTKNTHMHAQRERERNVENKWMGNIYYEKLRKKQKNAGE